MRSSGLLVLSLLVVTACGDDGDGGDVDAAQPSRDLMFEATVGADGLSAPVDFMVPDGTRSMTIIVSGAADALYALGALRTPDGVEQVGLPAGAPGPLMTAAYHDEQSGQMPGALYQSIRLGTFAHVYPYRPGQPLPGGAASLRVASTTPGPVTVRILLAPDDGSLTLHLNVVVVSDVIDVPRPPTWLDEVQAIYATTGITVVVDAVTTIEGTALENLTESTEPQEAPGSMAAMLPGLVGAGPSAHALDLFIVESLPAGIAGLSLGVPGPPLRGSYYFGVIVRTSVNDPQFARVIAHEVAHFLALQHVQNVGVSGEIYPDPLDDTSPGQGNLMESGTALTADQSFALTRSWLLRPQ